MTQSADPDYSSGDDAGAHCPYHNRLSAISSWIVILLCVALIVTLNRLESTQRASESPNKLAPNVQLEIIARYAVASSAMVKRPTPQQIPIDPAPIYLSQLDTVARSTPDHFRVAIVAGELSGATSAMQRIAAAGTSRRSPDLSADAAALSTVYGADSTALSGEARSRLIARYGWFGHLALGFGKTAADPDRKVAMQAAWRAMTVILGVGCVAGAALIAGVVLAIIALVKIAEGKIRTAYTPVVTNTVPFLEGFAIYLALMIIISSLVGRFSGHVTINAAYLIAGCVPVATGLAWPLLRGVTCSQLRYGLGWHLGTGLFREMFWGIVGYIAGLPLLLAGAILTLILSKISGAQTAHPIINEASGLHSAVRLFLLASVFAPLAEESLFRGALFHHLRQRHGWWLSALIVSLIFAAIHPQGWAAIPPLAMIALTFAAIREWRGTIVASATAHALNNGVIMLVLVIGTS